MARNTRRYTQNEKLDALTKYVENDYNTLKTATEIGVPHSTLQGWIYSNKEYIEKYSAKILEKKREKMARIFVEKGLANSNKLQEKISKSLEEGTPIDVDESVIQAMQKTSSYMGTMYDKYRLETGQSTENVGINLKELIEQVKGNEW